MVTLLTSAVAAAHDTASDQTVVLDMDGTEVRARLYSNTAARSFQASLPLSISVSRAEDDLCGTVSEQLSVDHAEDHDTWKIGEIGWFDGWFTILCDNEDGMRKRRRTIIAKIVDEDIPYVRSLRGNVNIMITAGPAR